MSFHVPAPSRCAPYPRRRLVPNRRVGSSLSKAFEQARAVVPQVCGGVGVCLTYLLSRGECPLLFSTHRPLCLISARQAALAAEAGAAQAAKEAEAAAAAQEAEAAAAAQETEAAAAAREAEAAAAVKAAAAAAEAEAEAQEVAEEEAAAEASRLAAAAEAEAEASRVAAAADAEAEAEEVRCARNSLAFGLFPLYLLRPSQNVQCFQYSIAGRLSGCVRVDTDTFALMSVRGWLLGVRSPRRIAP